MPRVERQGSDFQVDAALLTEAFDLPEDEIRARMRDGRITSRCERGEDEHQGRWRLTFHHEEKAVRLIVDDAGEVLTRASFPIRDRS